MNTKVLPDKPNRTMDDIYLTFLIREAMVSLINFLRAHSFQSEDISVSRSSPSGTDHQLLQRPNIGDASISFNNERLELPASIALLDYIWEHGGHQMTLSSDHGDPSREGWAEHAYHMIVAH